MVYYASLICPIEKEKVYIDGDEEEQEESDETLTIEVVAKFDNKYDYECQESTNFDMGLPHINDYISSKKPGWYLSDTIDVGEVYETYRGKPCDLTRCTVKRFSTAHAQKFATNSVILEKFFGEKTKDVFVRAGEEPQIPDVMKRMILWNLKGGERPSREEFQILCDFSEDMQVNLLNQGLTEELAELSPTDVDDGLFLDTVFKEVAAAMTMFKKKQKTGGE